ncbi:MAG: Hsp20/alpha crystallin family protein [Hyphomicrobiales bacterium]
MALVRWNPARDLIRDDMSRLMDEFFGRRFDVESSTVWQPAVDIEEGTEGYTVRAELPGMKLEDIKITLADGQLVIRGEKRREEEKSGSSFHRVERVYGTFERAFTLGHALKTDRIEATYRDGVLEVFVPKAEEAKAREIPIKVAK